MFQNWTPKGNVILPRGYMSKISWIRFQIPENLPFRLSQIIGIIYLSGIILLPSRSLSLELTFGKLSLTFVENHSMQYVEMRLPCVVWVVKDRQCSPENPWDNSDKSWSTTASGDDCVLGGVGEDRKGSSHWWVWGGSEVCPALDWHLHRTYWQTFCSLFLFLHLTTVPSFFFFPSF